MLFARRSEVKDRDDRYAKIDACTRDLASVYINLALFPHVTAFRFPEISFDGAAHPHLLSLYKRLRELDVCRADVARTQAFLCAAGTTLARPPRIVWRGDRIEWMLARGFHDWLCNEIRQGRVAWPRR